MPHPGYPLTHICPKCNSELTPEERGEHEGLCADCAKEAEYKTQADPFVIEQLEARDTL